MDTGCLVRENQQVTLDIREFLQSLSVSVDSRNTGQLQMSEAEERTLRQLKPPELSSYDLSRCCLPGTRENVIRDIVRWASLSNRPSRIFWLYGVAGCGKSSVAASVASALEQSCLLYSFICKRDDPERRNPIRVVQTVAYFLAKSSLFYKDALLDKLRFDEMIVQKPLLNQFKALLTDPLRDIEHSTQPFEPITIILDALDECDKHDALSELLAQAVSFAPWVKLIITSRPLPGIERGLLSAGKLTTKYDLFRVSAENDILAYTRHRFEVDRNLASLRGLVTLSEIERLAGKAMGLFIWISVVCSYISQRKSGRLSLLKSIISSTGALDTEKHLDELYLQVLTDAAGSERVPANKGDIRLILGLVCATSRNKALPATALFAFWPNNEETSQAEWEDMLRDLGSVLTIDAHSNAIRVCHKSLLDFLTTRERAGEFWARPEDLERVMAERCFVIMKSQLKFNICGLKTSYLPNKKVNDLDVNRHISRELHYSCLYWLDHMSGCTHGIVLLDPMYKMLYDIFCHTAALYWLEVLSLLSELGQAGVLLRDLIDLLKVC